MFDDAPRDPTDSAPVFELPDVSAEPVFLVDDDPAVLGSIQRFLNRVGYLVEPFGSPVDALSALRDKPPKVMITDKDMGGMDGLDLAERALELDPEIRIILVTGVGDEVTAQAALRLGLSDYIPKPVDLKDLALAVQSAFAAHARDEYLIAVDTWMQGELRRRTLQTREVMLSSLAALVNALEARSPHFKGHSRSVGECAEGIARALALPAPAIEAIQNAGLLHDVGMIAVPDAVVDKPGELSFEEEAAVRAHCAKGAEILSPLRHMEDSIRYVLEHHEHLDGSGYPSAKRGVDISLGGQVVGLAETWTALIESRSFRDGMSRSEALATIAGTAGTWFAPEVVDALRTSATG